LSAHGYQIYLPRAFVSAGRALERDEFAVAHQYPFLAFNFFAVAKGRPLGRKRVNRPQPSALCSRTVDAAQLV
jgi:hypothetical protein